MYKIEKKRTGTSYFKKEGELNYDLKRNNTIKIKVFGITIYSKSDIITDYDVVDIGNGKCGFGRNNH